MNMNTLKMEIKKKVAKMNHADFDHFISEINRLYLNAHPGREMERE